MKLIRFFRTGVFLLTAAGDDRLFGTDKNDTFTAEAGTLQAGDQLLDQSTTDNDTLNAVITNANRDIAPTLLNIENVNLDLDVFSGAAFDAANTEGATITASSSKLGFNGEFTLNTAGDNNVVAGENVTNLIVNALEAGSVDTGAAEEATVTTDSVNDDANVTINGDIDLTVATSDTLNLTATADSVVNLTQTANSVDTIVGSGEGAITLRGDATQLTGDNITGVSSVVIASGAGAVDASEIEADLTLATDLSNTLTVATGANVAIAEEQTNLNIAGQDNNSTVNVTSDLAALGTLVFAGASLASAELQLSAANAEVTSLTADDLALTVNIAEGAEITTLDGTAIDFVGAGDVVVTTGTNADVLDASGLDGDLELTSAATGSQEIAGAVGNNTIVFGATANTGVAPNVVTNTATFVGQSGNDDVTFGATSGNVEATFAGGNNEITFTGAFAGEANVVFGAGDDTVTLNTTLANTATMAINFGEGNDTLVLKGGVNTNAADLTLVGLENIVVETGTSIMAAEQLDGQGYSISGEGFANSNLTVQAGNDGESIDLSGLTLSDSASSGAKVSIVGGDGTDTIVANALGGDITGGGSADSITLGAGADNVVYAAIGDSAAAAVDGTGSFGIDSITGFDTAEDSIDLSALTALLNGTKVGFVNDLIDANTGALKNSGTGIFADGTDPVFDVVFGTYNGNTYAYVNTETDADYNGPASDVDATFDMVIKLSGVELGSGDTGVFTFV